MQSEKEFQAAVVELAQLTGWAVYHTFDSRRSAPGFPDLVLARPPQVIFAELKSAKGKVSEAQAVWLELLGECSGVQATLWRPDDWNEIEQELQR